MQQWMLVQGMTAHPAPEIPARLASDNEISRGPKNIKTRAENNGWTVTVTFARGTQLGRTPRVVNSIVLRMERGNEYAVAVWHDGKFNCAYVWRVDSIVSHPRKVPVTELRTWLA